MSMMRTRAQALAKRKIDEEQYESRVVRCKVDTSLNSDDKFSCQVDFLEDSCSSSNCLVTGSEEESSRNLDPWIGISRNEGVKVDETSTCNLDNRKSGSTSSSRKSNRPRGEPRVNSSSELLEHNSLQMMTSTNEIEEFFSAAEKHLQKQFADKYNFDVANDVPLEGRYEWVLIKPEEKITN